MRPHARFVVTLLCEMALLAGCRPEPAAPTPDPMVPGERGTGGRTGSAGRGGTGAVGGGGTGAVGGGGAAGGAGGGISADGSAQPTAGSGPDAPPPADAAGAIEAGGPPIDSAADAPATPSGPDAASGAWAALTAGWTQKPFTYAIHKPYNLAQSERYSFDAATNTHTFWTFSSDKPHLPPPNTTGPRTELRMNNDYRSGNHQFEADIYVVAGTDGASIMQVFGGIEHSTAIMLFAHNRNGGTISRYSTSAVIKEMAYDRWWHLNVIHEASATGTGKIRVYADGKLMGTFDDRGSTGHYFKCGVYNNSGNRAESRIRNIKYWVK